MLRAPKVSCFVLWLLATSPALANEVGLITGLQGRVLNTPAMGQEAPLPAFSKVQEGDHLQLDADARLQLVVFKSGEEQVWVGPGKLQVLAGGTRPLSPGWQAQIRTLPKVLVKQLARTPAPDGQIKAGMVRLRAMPAGGTLESVEKNYKQLRQSALAGDRNPELYLLAGYFELHEFERLEQLLTDMGQRYPGDGEIELLRSLYTRAINNAKMAAEQ
jgi:hypothetical protein